MRGAFQIDYLLLCEFATLGMGNKLIAAGIIGGDMNLEAPPATWPTMQMVASFIPLTQKFDFVFRFGRPDGRNIVKLDGSFSLDREPSESDRSIFNVSIPQVPFPGTGRYMLQATDGEGNEIYSRSLDVKVGPLASLSKPKLTFNLTIDQP